MNTYTLYVDGHKLGDIFAANLKEAQRQASFYQRAPSNELALYYGGILMSMRDEDDWMYPKRPIFEPRRQDENLGNTSTG